MTTDGLNWHTSPGARPYFANPIEGIEPDHSHDAPEDSQAQFLGQQLAKGNLGIAFGGPGGLVWDALNAAKGFTPGAPAGFSNTAKPNTPPPESKPGAAQVAPPPALPPGILRSQGGSGGG
jgi:hypothetical protein